MIEKIFSNAWKKYKKHAPLIAGLMLAVSLLAAAAVAVAEFAFLGSAISKIKFTSPVMIAEYVLIILSLLASIYVSSVISSMAAGIKKYFKSGLTYMWDYLLVKIMISVILFAIMFVGIVPFFFKARALGVLTTIAGFVAVLYMSIKFLFAVPEIYIKRKNPVDAIKSSWKGTRGNFWNLVLILLSLVLINLVISFIPYIGGIISALVISPYTTFVIFEAFRTMKKRK